jgi:hypothetical protein
MIQKQLLTSFLPLLICVELFVHYATQSTSVSCRFPTFLYAKFNTDFSVFFFLYILLEILFQVMTVTLSLIYTYIDICIVWNNNKFSIFYLANYLFICNFFFVHISYCDCDLTYIFSVGVPGGADVCLQFSFISLGNFCRWLAIGFVPNFKYLSEWKQWWN